ncbi:MAG: carbohydrate ABC transporter permease [Spirochaetia bacterium]|nr:carbohydrate ABC transporter permease [Spirochaetia bacterium]
MKSVTRKRIGKTVLMIFVIIASLVCIFPIYEMISTSLKYDVDAFSLPPKWIFTPTFDNYTSIFVSSNFGRYFINSVLVALLATFFSVFLGALAGYSIARFRYKGKKLIVILTLLMRMIPPVILVVPVFILWTKMGISDTRFGLVIVYVALNLPFNIWVLKTFIADIPYSLDESAIIDGCSDWTVFRKIILPLIAPGIAVASIFTFRISWNEYILSLVLTNRFTRTLPVAVSLYLTDAGTEWGKITAIATIIAIPAFIFTFTAAKQLITGMTAGAVKG